MFPPEAGSSWGRSKAGFWLMVPGISAPGCYGPTKRQNIGVQRCGGDSWSPFGSWEGGYTMEAEDKGKRRERQGRPSKGTSPGPHFFHLGPTSCFPTPTNSTVGLCVVHWLGQNPND